MLSAPLSSGGGAWSPCYLWGPGSQCEGISPPRPRRLSSHSHIPREGRPLPAAAPPTPCSQSEGRSRQPPPPQCWWPRCASSAPTQGERRFTHVFLPPAPHLAEAHRWAAPHRMHPLSGPQDPPKHAHARARAVGPHFRWGRPLHPDPALPNPAANAGRGPRPSARPLRATSLTQGLHGATPLPLPCPSQACSDPVLGPSRPRTLA